MGLVTWKNSPEGRILKSDVSVAKNKAEKEYDVFNKTQYIESDFDKEVKKLLQQEKSISGQA